MPVWHEALEALRERDDLVVIGVTQEQHPDRCALYAQWQELDWPILWDPFDLLGVQAVPLTFAIDEHGTLRGDRFHPDRIHDEGGLVAAFLDREFAAPARPGYSPRRIEPIREDAVYPQDEETARWLRLARLLYGDPFAAPGSPQAEQAQAALRALQGTSASEDARPSDHFRLGVALRMRHDSPLRQPTDFQAALDAWGRALVGDPGQYIWRRRIQQWGPRLDKPYPFYDWVSTARAAILARGDRPRPLPVRLSGAEVATGTSAYPVAAEARHPDPDGKVPLDARGRARLDVAVAHHTGYSNQRWRVRPGTSRVHLTLVPDTRAGVRFEDEGGVCEAWIDVPEGWLHEGQRLILRSAPDAGPAAPRGLDFELAPPEGHVGPATLSGVVLYSVCVGEDGACTYLRQPFTFEVPAPPGEAGPPNIPPPDDD